MAKKKTGLNAAEQLMYLDYLEILDSKNLYPTGWTSKNLLAIEDYFLKMHNRFTIFSEEAAMTNEQANKFSWSKWQSRAQLPVNYNRIRALIKLQLAADFDVITGPNGFLSCKRPSGEVFGRLDMQKIYELQNGKMRNGDPIDIYDLYFGGRYEIDHVQSLADGGKTIISNGEILEAQDNRVKASKSAKPGFDFQDKIDELPASSQQELEI